MCASSREVQAQRFLEEADELLRLGRSTEAVSVARKAARLIRDPFLRAFNLAAVLIDAGAELKKGRYVREGIATLRSVESKVPSESLSGFHYNLGNAYATIGRWERGIGAGTKPSLAAAISHLDEAMKLKPAPEARANLAGVLLVQGRWIEALDEFSALLDQVPDHHSALARRGSCLMGIFNWTPGHKGLLIAALADHESAVELARDEPVFQESYRAAVAQLRGRGISPYYPSVKEPTPDQRWIWENQLALNPCPLCRIESPDAFDLYPLAARLEGGKRQPPVEALLDMVNSICRSYAVARWMLYRGLRRPPAETDHVITLEGAKGARHDLSMGLVMAAAAGFYGILGQIASALNSYFDLGHNVQQVTFQTIWAPTAKKKRGVPAARKGLHHRLTRFPAPALSALHRLALSLEHGLGRYQDLRELRNRIEHHVVVALPDAENSPYYVTIAPSNLESQALKMGRIAKAAIWYFGGTVLRGEQERLKRALKHGQHVAHRRGPSVDRR